MEHDEVIEACADWFKSNSQVVLISKGYGGNFPNPDIRAQFQNDKVAVVECKPSDAGGREYLTGLGQSIAYLTLADYSYLAIPEKEMLEFEQYFWIDDIGLLSINDNMSISIKRDASQSQVLVSRERPRDRGYGYYRDLRPLEIHAVLKAIERARVRRTIPSVQQVKDVIWQQICRLRQIRSQRQKNSFLLNIQLLLRDLQIINPEDFSLTSDGIRLLQLGERRNKQPYMNALARCFLINANYLDIVTIIQSLNDRHSGFTSVSNFKTYLTNEIIRQKLATPSTNVLRDLQDIPRILRDLNIISDWQQVGLVNRHVVNWKYILSVI